MAAADPEALLTIWFGDTDASSSTAARSPSEVLEAQVRRWFESSAAFDAVLRDCFGQLPDAASSGELTAWREAPRSALALVIALDQLPRNLYRDRARAFAYDPAAREAASDALRRGFDAELPPEQAMFLYLPFEHAEDLELQRESVRLFRALLARVPAELHPQFESFLAYAERHRAVIERFGRFPHRSAALGRKATEAEERYLASGGETFAKTRGADA